MPYDLTYKWNLMKETTNQQNRTRGMETRNGLTRTRGEGGGGYGRKEGAGPSTIYE